MTINPWDMPNPITRIAAEQDRLSEANAHLQLVGLGPDRTLWESIAVHAAGEIARWESIIAQLKAMTP